MEQIGTVIDSGTVVKNGITYTYTTTKFKNCIARAYHPVLSQEEYDRRMNDIKKATEVFMKEVIAQQEAMKVEKI